MIEILEQPKRYGATDSEIRAFNKGWNVGYIEGYDEAYYDALAQQ